MMPKKVLVVDDSNLARMMMRNVISKNFSEWLLLETADPQQALELVEQQQPQVALLDYNMPEINGLELALLLMSKAPQLSIHLVTANIQDATRQRAEAAGIGFVCKPVDIQALQAILGQF